MRSSYAAFRVCMHRRFGKMESAQLLAEMPAARRSGFFRICQQESRARIALA